LTKGGWLTRNVFFMGLTSLLSDAGHEMATAILPFFLTLELGAGPGVLGLIEGASDGASSLTKSFAGYLSDRSGKRKPLVNAGYLATGLLIPLMGVAKSWPQALVLRMGGWAGRGARGPPRDALLSESVRDEARGRAFGFHRAMDTIGATIGPAIALLLTGYLGYREIFFVSLVPGMAAFLIVSLLVKEARRPPPEGRGTDGDAPTKPKGYLGAMKGLPRDFKLFLIGVGVFGLGNFANSLFALRAQEVLAPGMGREAASVAAVGLYTLLNFVYAASSLPLGALSDRIGKRAVLSFGYLLSAVTCLLTALLTDDMLFLLSVFFLAGVFTGATDTVEGAAAADLLPTEARGTGYGLLHTVNGVGDFVSSSLVGLLWTTVSAEVAFGYAAALSALGGALLLLVMRPARSGRPKPDAGP
jgi:MFS family permease